MYLTIAILTTAAFGGLTVYANPLPFAKRSSTEGPSIAVKHQSADCICGDEVVPFCKASECLQAANRPKCLQLLLPS
jgi:hypothetical protein